MDNYANYGQFHGLESPKKREVSDKIDTKVSVAHPHIVKWFSENEFIKDNLNRIEIKSRKTICSCKLANVI